LLAQGRQFQPEILTGDIQPRRGSTLFVATGNTTVIVLCLVLLGAFWMRSRH
jgi:apolipoprotein N-acyltransferase